MRVFLLFLFIIYVDKASAQTYTYKPLNLDTTCYWTSNFYWYYGGIVCKGEKQSVVVGDTLIGSEVFTKILTYTTANTSINSASNCLGYFDPQLNYLREDTVARKVYSYDRFGTVLFVDYSKNVGDSLTFMGSKVDSVTIQNVYGVDRRMQWGKTTSPFWNVYRTIEGVGANQHFPVKLFGEWGIPAYQLACFSKGGQILYTDSATSTCPRKPAIKLGVERNTELSSSSFLLSGHSIRIPDAHQLPLTIQVIDMTGRLQRKFEVKTTAEMSLDLVPGIYVLRLVKNSEAMAYRVLIQ